MKVRDVLHEQFQAQFKEKILNKEDELPANSVVVYSALSKRNWGETADRAVFVQSESDEDIETSLSILLCQACRPLPPSSRDLEEVAAAHKAALVRYGPMHRF